MPVCLRSSPQQALPTAFRDVSGTAPVCLGCKTPGACFPVRPRLKAFGLAKERIPIAVFHREESYLRRKNVLRTGVAVLSLWMV